MLKASKIGVGRVYSFTRLTSAGLEALHEAQDALVDLFVVHPDGLEAVGQLVAQNALHDIQIVVQQERRGFLFGLLADVEPEVVQEAHVGRDFFLGVAFAGGADDEAAGHAGMVGLEDALQAQALFVAGDLARDAHVLHRRHVDHVAAGQGDVRRDARALLAERLLGDLDDDLLALFQQFGDRRQRRAFAALGAACATGSVRGRYRCGRGFGCGFDGRDFGGRSVSTTWPSALGSGRPSGRPSGLPSPPRIRRRMRRVRRCM